MRIVYSVCLLLLSYLAYAQPMHQMRMGQSHGFDFPGVSDSGNIDSMLYYVVLGSGAYSYDGYKTKAVDVNLPEGMEIHNIRKLRGDIYIIDQNNNCYRVTADSLRPSFDFRSLVGGKYSCKIKEDTVFVYDFFSEQCLKRYVLPPNFITPTLTSFFLDVRDTLYIINTNYESQKYSMYNLETSEMIEPKIHYSLFFEPQATQDAFYAFLEKHYGDRLQWNYLVPSISHFKDNIYLLRVGTHEYAVIRLDKELELISQIKFDSRVQIRTNHEFDHCLFFCAHEGLFKVNPFIQHYGKENYNLVPDILTIAPYDDYLFVGGYGGGQGLLHADGFEKIEPQHKYTRGMNTLSGSLQTADTELWFFTESRFALSRYKDGRIRSYCLKIDGEMGYFNTGYCIDTLADGRMAFGLAREAFGIATALHGDTIEVQSYGKAHGIELVNVIDFEQDANGRVWMCRGSTGIAVLDLEKDKGKSFLRKDNSLQPGATDLAYDRYDNLWISSTEGLYLVERASQVDFEQQAFHDFARRIELPNGERCKGAAIHIYKDFLVNASEHSISYIHLPTWQANQEETLIGQFVYGVDLQGGATRQSCLASFDDKLWVATNTGVLCFHEEAFVFDTLAVKIALESCKIGGVEQSFESSIELPFDKRNIQIEIGLAYNPSMNRNVYFDYYLIYEQRKDTLIQDSYVMHPAFSIPYVPPGEYSLQIKARKNGKIVDQLSIPVIAPLSLSENTWFWSALTLVAALAIISFILFRNRQQKRLLKYEKSILKKDLALQLS